MGAARGAWTWLAAGLVLAWGVWTAASAQDAYEFLITGGAGWSFFAAGLLVLSIRPRHRTGLLLLLVSAGFVLISLEVHTRVPLLWTAGAALACGPAVLTYALLSFPDGRLPDRTSRLLVVLAFLQQPLLQGIAAGRFYDPRDWGCTDCPQGLNLVLVRSDPALVLLLNRDIGLRLAAGIAIATALLLGRRYLRASVPLRRVLLPVWVLSLVLVPIALGNLFASFGDFDRWLAVQQYVVGPLVVAAPAAFAVGLLRLRARRSRVGQLVVRLGEARDASALSAALRHALGDPGAEVGLWDPGRREYLTVVGGPLPAADGRATTRLDGEDGPIALLVHDPALAEEPELLQAAAAAARLAVDNARLAERLSAQLGEVERSRARILQAADEARRQVERDLHDGAQQRLVGLLMRLRSGEASARGQGDAGLTDVLAKASTDLERALAELRELAHGLHPPLLADAGLAASLEDLVEASPLPVHLEVVGGRFPAAVESASYFTVAEALANVAKHARASRATVRVSRSAEGLRVVVDDDGAGGADPARGTGLRGLQDRLAAAGGTLSVRDAPGGGTTVTAEVPCAS